MAYPAYIDNGGIAAAGDYSVDVPYPSTVNANDILIVQLLDADNDSFSPPDESWKEIYQEGASGNASHAYFWKRAVGTESGTATFTSLLNSGAGVYGVMPRYSGCLESGTPFEGVNGQAVVQTTTPTVPALTLSNGQRLAIGFVTVEDNIAVTGESNYTSGYQETSTFGGDANLAMFYQQVTSSPSSEALSCGNEYIGVLGFALIPQPDVPVTLNTADLHDFGDDTTPTVEFTGDAASNLDIEYEIQIDTVSTFDSQNGEIVGDSYSESNQDGFIDTQAVGNYIYRGQSFLSSVGNDLLKAKFYLKSIGAPLGTVVAQLWSIDNDTLGVGNYPNTLLATSDSVDVSTIGSSPSILDFAFTGGDQYTIVDSVAYVIVLYFNYTSADIGNQIQIGVDASSPTHQGDMYFDDGTFSWISASNINVCFYVILNNNYPLLDKLSETPDTGFVNTVSGGDTHPFNDNEKVSYTVQSGDALAYDTYYWRVRAKNPTAENIYDDWSATRSFDVTEAGGVITGSIDGVSEVLGDLKGKGKLTSTIDASSEILGLIAGLIKGTVTVNSSSEVTGSISSKNAITAQTDGQTTTAGILKAKGKLIVTVNANSDTVGFISATVDISGTSDTVSEVLGVLIAKGKLTSTVSGQSTITGNLVNAAAVESISGTTDGVSNIIGSLLGKGKLLSAVDGVSEILGLLKAKGILQGTADLSSDVTGILIALGKLIGTIDCETEILGVLYAKGKLTVTVGAASEITGSLIAKGKLSVTIDCSSTVTGVLATENELIGTVDANSDVTGLLKGSGKLQATIDTASSVAGNLIGIKNISVLIESSTAVTGSLKGQTELKVTIDTQTTVSGVLSGVSHIVGDISSSTTITGNLIAKGTLVGEVDTVSIVTGAISSGISLKVNINASTDVTGKLLACGKLTTNIDAVSEVTGTLKGKAKLIVSVDTSSTVQADLAGKAILQSTVNGGSEVTGILEGKGFIQGVISSSSDVTGIMFVTATEYISGTINGSSAVTAQLSWYGGYYVRSAILRELEIDSKIKRSINIESAIDRELEITSKIKRSIYVRSAIERELENDTKIIK